jgi:hypothetical protein
LDQSTTIEPPWPSKESLTNLHNALSIALDVFQKSNPTIPTPITCGCALQIMLNFPHKWMTESKKGDQFVSVMTLQAEQFLQLKAKAEKEKSNSSTSK